jgi:peptidoglycan/xylan/chitin deacetylase (PgdA/CDA1 family)
MGRVDERREIIEGLSGDQAWRCLGLVIKDDREHDAALHANDLPPPVSEGARREVQAILRTLPEAARARGDPPASRRRPPDADEERVRRLLLVMLEYNDRHWGEKHADQPKPGVEYLLGLVNRARIHGRY